MESFWKDTGRIDEQRVVLMDNNFLAMESRYLDPEVETMGDYLEVLEVNDATGNNNG